MSRRVAQGTRDYDEALDDRSCTRLPFPCSENLGSSGSSRNFRREFSGCEQDSVVAVRVCKMDEINC